MYSIKIYTLACYDLSRRNKRIPSVTCIPRVSWELNVLNKVFSLRYYSNIFTSCIQSIRIDLINKYIFSSYWYHSYRNIDKNTNKVILLWNYKLQCIFVCKYSILLVTLRNIVYSRYFVTWYFFCDYIRYSHFLIRFLMKYQHNKWIIKFFLKRWYHDYRNYSIYQKGRTT